MKKQYLFPAVVVAGIAIYYFVTKKPASNVTDIAPVIDDPTAGYLYDPLTGKLLQPANTTVKTYVPTAPANTVLTGGDNSISSGYLSGLASAFGASNPLMAIFKTRTASDLSYLNGFLSYIPASNTTYWNVFAKMTPQELVTTWRYITMYLSTGMPLLSQTKMLANGQWDNSNPGDPNTYNAVLAIHNKYGIF